MSLDESIVTELARQLCKRIADSTKQCLEEMEPSGLAGEDSTLSSVWEEFCAQVQWDQSVHWQAYLDTISGFLEGEIELLKDFERQAIWLQTESGFDWACDHASDETESPSKVPVNNTDIRDHVFEDFVVPLARDYQSPSLKKFLRRNFD